MMVAPVVLGLALFQLVPLVWAVVESSLAFNPISHKATGFVGLDNYAFIFSDDGFWQAVRNTMVYWIVISAIEVPLALGIALLLHRVVPATRFARAAIISALALSESVVAVLWLTVYNRDTGVANGIFMSLGLPPQSWLSSESLAIWSVVMMSVWKDVGLIVLIYLAGLQSLDEDALSASEIDGANAWQRFRYIMLPLLKRSTLIVLFMVTIGATRIFTGIILMTQGGPNGSTTNLIYYAYQQGIQFFDYGVGSAATVCMILFLVVVTAVQGVLLKERD